MNSLHGLVYLLKLQLEQTPGTFSYARIDLCRHRYVCLSVWQRLTANKTGWFEELAELLSQHRVPLKLASWLLLQSGACMLAGSSGQLELAGKEKSTSGHSGEVEKHLM